MRVRRQAPSILSLKTLFRVFIYLLLWCLNSHSLQQHSYFLMLSIFLFCCSHGEHFLGIRHRCSPLFSYFLLFSSLCALVLTKSTSILYFFRYGTGPVRDDSSSASTLQSPIVAADPLDQKQ
jgi:hypothetical protein